jgi:hypothetical protein
VIVSSLKTLSPFAGPLIYRRPHLLPISSSYLFYLASYTPWGSIVLSSLFVYPVLKVSLCNIYSPRGHWWKAQTLVRPPPCCSASDLVLRTYFSYKWISIVTLCCIFLLTILYRPPVSTRCASNRPSVICLTKLSTLIFYGSTPSYLNRSIVNTMPTGYGSKQDLRSSEQNQASKSY